MNTRITRGATALALAGLLAGCAGGGAGTTSSMMPSSSPARGSSSVALRVVIPQASTSSTTRSTQHLPATTKSMAVLVNANPAPQVIGLQPTDPGCSSSGGHTVCTATITAPIGADTFDLTTYDGTAASGAKLSHANVAKTVNAGTNAFAIVLGGVVTSITISAAGTIYEGAATSTAVGNVVAKDADGNVIMDAYDQAVTVSGSGTFAGTSGTLAKSGDTMTLHYNGTDPANVSASTFTGHSGSAPIVVNLGTIVSTPLNLAAASVALWYDAADASSIVAGGSSFTWKDRSGNAKDATSTAGDPLPTYPDATPPTGATHAFVRFTNGAYPSSGPPATAAGPGAFLSRADGFPANDYSIFAVAYDSHADGSGSVPPGSSNPGAILGGGIGTAPPNGHALMLTAPGTLCLYEANSNCTAVQAAIATTNPTFANTLYRVTGTYSNAFGNQSGTISINGAAAAPGFASGATPPRVTDPSVVINGYKTDGLTSGNDSIGEIIVLDHVASTAEQTAIAAYLKAKWGLAQ